MKIDFCIVGLGNPGTKYVPTRHNIGFLTADKLAKFFNIKEIFEEEKYALAFGFHGDKTVALMKPLTYMNLSGEAVREFIDNYDVPLSNMLVVFDDVNLEFGTLRIRPSGSDGGQKGMYSVIYELMTENIPRLRLGIKNEEEIPKYQSLSDFVLSDFTEKEKKNLGKVLDSTRDAVISFMDEGIEAAMNKYNRNVLDNFKRQ